MNNELISNEDLIVPNKRRYFQSILSLGTESGAIKEEDVRKIQQQYFLLAYGQCELYAGQGTYSIGTDVFQSILQSIVYIISLKLKSFNSPKAAIKLLNESPIDEIYYGGKAMLEMMLKKIAEYNDEILHGGYMVSNYIFRQSQIEGVAAYVKKYDCVCAADKEPEFLSYPVYNFPEDSYGIEYVLKYEEAALFETRFMRIFDHSNVDELLGEAAKMDAATVYDMTDNLYVYVLLHSLLNEILNKNSERLVLESYEAERVKAYIKSLSLQELVSVLREALDALSKRYGISEDVYSYAQKSIEPLSNELKLENGIRMNQLIITEQYEENSLSFDTSLSREDFEFVAECLKTSDGDDKLDVIAYNIKTLAEFEMLAERCGLESDFIIACFNKIERPLLSDILQKYLSSDGENKSGEISKAVRQYSATLGGNR